MIETFFVCTKEKRESRSMRAIVKRTLQAKTMRERALMSRLEAKEYVRTYFNSRRICTGYTQSTSFSRTKKDVQIETLKSFIYGGSIALGRVERLYQSPRRYPMKKNPECDVAFRRITARQTCLIGYWIGVRN